MAFIDQSFFVGEIALPNLDQEDTVLADLQQAIAQYEKELLIKLLGYELYKSLMADSIIVPTPPTRWTNFLNGAEFTLTYNTHEVLLKWPGLAPASKTDSILAYYCYYKIMERELSRTAGTGGVVVTMMEASERKSAKYKMMNAWERLLELYGEVNTKYFKTYSEVYRTYTDKPSAYNFLNTNIVDYEGWRFSPLDQRMNKFGI